MQDDTPGSGLFLSAVSQMSHSAHLEEKISQTAYTKLAPWVVAKKEQASSCCTADVCLRQTVNQLYNNQKMA